MLATYDFKSVSEFANRLKSRASDSSHFDDLENRIGQQVADGDTLVTEVVKWVECVYRGLTAYDEHAEAIFRGEVERILAVSKQLAEQARHAGALAQVPLVAALNRVIVHLDHVRAHWVSPRLAVSPGPRVRLGSTAIEKMREKLLALRPLPAGWEPKNPDQLDAFQRLRPTK